LVCRATGDSLVRVARAAQLVVADRGPGQVLAITAADVSGPTRPFASWQTREHGYRAPTDPRRL